MSKKVLRIAYGEPKVTFVPPVFQQQGWRETVVDITGTPEQQFAPQTALLRSQGENKFDAVSLQHCVQKMLHFQVLEILEACRFVLKPQGFIHATGPDASKACTLLANGQGDEVLYTTQQLGDVTPYDVLYGHRQQVKDVPVTAQNRSCYTPVALGRVARAAGFMNIQVKRDGTAFVCVCHKPAPGYDVTNEKIRVIEPDKSDRGDELDISPVRWTPLGFQK